MTTKTTLSSAFLAGAVAAVLALAEQANGSSGHYGSGAAGDGGLPAGQPASTPDDNKKRDRR